MTVEDNWVFNLFFPYSTFDASKYSIEYNNKNLTYENLYSSVLKLSDTMRVKGIGHEDRAVICTADPLMFCVSLMACVYRGTVFIPMPMDSPVERKKVIIEDAKPQCLFYGDPTEIEGLSPLCRETVPIELFSVPDPEFTGPKPSPSMDMSSIAYIAYTSGSSGLPKGVCIRYESIYNICVNLQKDYGFNREARVLPLFALHFDGTLGSIFGTFFCGGTLIFSKANLRIPRILVSHIKSYKITHLGITPSVLKLILPALKKIPKEENSIKTVGLGGEVCRAEDVKELIEHFPSLSVFNRYGPTEATVTVFSHHITLADTEKYASNIPIGYPLKNVSACIIGDDLKKVGPGEIGELCIGGVQVMTGYWGSKELTRQVLLTVDGETLYRTGDLAYYNEDGLFFFLSRKNDIVKRNGNRIHLFEIENALQKIESVENNLCISVNKDNDSKIIAYIVANKKREQNHWRSELARFLPLYMLPDEFVLVPELPIMSSGKVDRVRALCLYEGKTK